jgi:hypothetical protein
LSDGTRSIQKAHWSFLEYVPTGLSKVAILALRGLVVIVIVVININIIIFINVYILLFSLLNDNWIRVNTIIIIIIILLLLLLSWLA